MSDPFNGVGASHHGTQRTTIRTTTPGAAMSDMLQLIESHTAHLDFTGARRNTIRSKQHVLRMLSRFGGDKDLVDLTAQDIVRFLARPELSRNSRSTYLAHIRAFYRWAKREGIITDDPTAELRGPRAVRGLPRPMPVADFLRAVTQARGNVRTWLLLGGYGGLRCCEMAALKGTDVTLEGTPVLRVTGKGGKPGIIPLHPILAAELAPRWREGWLFPHQHRPQTHVLASSVSTCINTHLHSLGINSTAHSTRHLFATTMYRASLHDLRMTQELLRHASPTTTAVYTKVDPAESAIIMNQLNYG